MIVFLLLLLLMPSVVHAQVGDGVAVCCGATTARPDLPGRTDGFSRNLPPLDSLRFGQQFSRPSYGEQERRPPYQGDTNYATPYGLYNMDEGGYDPGVSLGNTVPRVKPWHRVDTPWATEKWEKAR